MIQVENLTIKFGGLVALNDVSFKVPKGSILGLIGPNGAGKTTCFNLITGVYEPTSGQVLLQDKTEEGTSKEIQGLLPYQINQLGIARTYQNINLFKKMTVLENVMVGCHSKSKAGLAAAIFRTKAQRMEERQVVEKSMDILKFMDLDSKANLLASNLSYGEQRRLEISRALASEPALLLLDEPAAGMNGTEKDELCKTIQNISKSGITVLLVEHDMTLVMKVTDQICVLNFGKKIAVGSPEEIQTNDDVIEAYLGGGLDV